MQEDFYEIQASFALQDSPVDKPASVIRFLKAKTVTKDIHIQKISQIEMVNK